MEESFITHTTEHVIKQDDDWGLGQIDIETILKMVEVGREIGLSFTCAKKVTAMDYEYCKRRTITANKGHLFVYPSHNGDLSDFWPRVEAKK